MKFDWVESATFKKNGRPLENEPTALGKEVMWPRNNGFVSKRMLQITRSVSKFIYIRESGQPPDLIRHLTKN
jgi:hypothetical protein